MIKAKAKARILLSGSIMISIIALACFAFAADSEENLLGVYEKDYSAMGSGNILYVTIDSKTGAIQADGWSIISANKLASSDFSSVVTQYQLSADALIKALGGGNPVITPPQGSSGLNPSITPPSINSGGNPSTAQTPGNVGGHSQPLNTPNQPTPSVWTYTPAVPRNYSLVTIVLPKAQYILGSDFIKRAPDRFLASTLVKLISQITINSPNINIPGLNASGINDAPLIAVVTTRGIAIYAPPANSGINTAQLSESNQAPSIRILSSPDYMKLTEPGFIAVSVGDIQATAPVTEDVSIPAMKPVNSRLPGYTTEVSDSSYITVVVTPTAIIYMPANKADIEDTKQTRSPMAALRLDDKTEIPEITISSPVWADDSIKLPETVSAPAAQISLGAESIRITEDGVISIETTDIKATVPSIDAAQLPDVPDIAVAITPDGMVYMPDPQTFTLAKKPSTPDQKAQTLIPEITISSPVWADETIKLPETAASTPAAQIILGADLIKISEDGVISIDTADIKATTPAADVGQLPDVPDIAVAITPDGMVYMPDPLTITIAKKALNPKADGSTNQVPADTLQISWETAKTAEPAVQKTKKSTKNIDVKAIISKANQAIVAKSKAFKAKQTAVVKKLAKMMAIHAGNITNKTAAFVIDTQKTIAKCVKFVKNAGDNAAGYINKLIKGLIQVLKMLGPIEPAVDRGNLPPAATDRQDDPFGPPLEKTHVKDITGDPVPFGALILRAIPNRITNANMFFVNTIKKNAVNYAHTGLSPPQTVSPNSTALLSASKGSVYFDSSFVISANSINKIVSPSLLNAFAFNFKAGDFCLYINLFKKGGSHD